MKKYLIMLLCTAFLFACVDPNAMAKGRKKGSKQVPPPCMTKIIKGCHAKPSYHVV